MRVLVACEFSGIVRDAFLARGHDAISIDLLPSELPGPHVQRDIREMRESWFESFDLMIAHPPCTHLAVSGARWFPKKRVEQEEALRFVWLFMGAYVPRIAIENPVSIISSAIRKPDQIIQPWQFGHAEPKATCLWLKGLPKLVPTNVVAPDFARWPDGSLKLGKRGQRYSATHWDSGRRVDRWKIRSRTYPGIASAMAEQWGTTTVRPLHAGSPVARTPLPAPGDPSTA